MRKRYLITILIAGILAMASVLQVSAATNEAGNNNAAAVSASDKDASASTQNGSGTETAPSNTPSAATALAAGVNSAVLGESADVGAHWFDDAAIVGDSISIYLSKLGGGEEGLGNATFLVAGCYSATNALSAVTGKSVHPSYKGTKMKTEDAIAMCGAKKVYIMLGMNDIGIGLDHAVEKYVTFVNKILEKSPDAKIFVESVTPMVKGSTSSGKSLNNTNINKFNERMMALCQENGWYYVDVASILKDSEGYLRPEYCNDNPTMGIHVQPSVIQLWTAYLRTHTPQK